MKKYCLVLDLKNDEALIKAYKEYHKAVWTEVLQSMKEAGILNMEIYNVGNRLTMIMEVSEDFSFKRNSEISTKNKKVQEWENLMWTYQQALPFAKSNEKWILMEKIFQS